MEIERIIDNIDSLKPVSSIGHRVMKIIYDPGSSLGELVDVIKYDQGMTANLLKICNSSLYGLKQKISSIKQAIAYLGTEKVACLLVMGNSAENFTKAQDGYDLETGELWRYSVASALIAQDIAERKGLKHISHLFTAALLKDIGKAVLNTYIRDSFERIMALVREKDLSFIEAERAIVGIDHAELGAMVADRWNFGPEMIDIIRHHHDPEKASTDDLTMAAIYLADSICMMIGIGVGSDGLAYRYHQEVVDRLGFTDIDLQKIIADFWEKLKSVEELVNLSGEIH